MSARTGNRVELFAVCAPGLEPTVAGELRKSGLASVVERHGGVSASATWPQVWHVNLWSRCASRILVRLARMSATTFNDLEFGLRRIDWSAWIADDAVVSVSAASSNSTLYHTGAIEERLLDSLLASGNRRPFEADNVGGSLAGDADPDDDPDDDDLDEDRAGGDDHPDPASAPAASKARTGTTGVLIRVVHDQITVSIDSSGDPLYKRGWREAVAKAPIRETLAAGLIAVSGWDAKAPLVDSFCGSGTLAIEAILSARRMAPGRHRSFGFQSWPTFESERWERLVTSADADIIDRTPTVIGADRDAGAITAARSNAERAGVAAFVEWREAAISELQVPKGRPGLLISNPPYGQRIGVTAATVTHAGRVGTVGGVAAARTWTGKPDLSDAPREQAARHGGDRRNVAASRNDRAVEERPTQRPSGRDIEADLRNLYDRWGQVVRSAAPGWTVAVVAQQGPLLDRFASRAGVTLEVMSTTSNGGIPVVFAKGSIPTS